MKRTMKVLVTGASGFLGRNVAEKLLQSGVKVIGFNRKVNMQLKEKGVKFIEGDLSDINLLTKALEGIDVVVHLAAETTAVDKKTNYLTNVLGTENIIHACKKNKVKKIVFTSSANALLQKNSHYGKSKALAEKAIIASNLDYVIFRPELIYGKGDRGLAKTIKLIQSLPIIPIVGNGKAKMQPIFVKDMASLIAIAATTNIKNKIYFAGGPESFSFNQYLDKICKELEIKKKKVHLPYFLALLAAKILSKVTSKPPVSLEQVYSMHQDKAYDVSNLQESFEFKLTKFEDGLKETLR